MRVTFVGASPLSRLAARGLTDRGHEVVVVEKNPDVAEALGDELDCGVVAGDGSRPGTLREVDPASSDFLFCLSDSDEANILAALVGRSLGFDRVVPKIEDAELESICTELGLDDVIVPDREVGLQLVDLVEGRDAAELTSVVRDGLRFLAITVPEGVTLAGDLDLPADARVIARSRKDASVLADLDTALEPGDELVLLVVDAEFDALCERFRRKD